MAVSVTRLGSAGQASTVTDAAQSDLITSANGSIGLRTLGGGIVLNDGSAPANGVAVKADGSGQVSLQAQGAGAVLDVPAQTIDQDGDYSFAGLAPSTDYRVRFINYTQEQFVRSDAGNDAVDSDINQAIGSDGQVNWVSVAAGQKVTNVDAGLVSRGFEYEKIDEADATSTVRSLGGELITNGAMNQRSRYRGIDTTR